MILPFKLFAFLPTAPIRHSRHGRRALAAAAIIACGGTMVPGTASLGHASERFPTVSTANASVLPAREALPARATSSRTHRASSIAVRSLRFRTDLTHRASLGEFVHVRPSADPVATPPTMATAPTRARPDILPGTGSRAQARAKDFVVMIDPGHGGTDQGARAFNGLLEKELTRDIGEQVDRFLSEIEGITVLMTRNGDEGLSRRQRVQRIRASQADLVLSLHFNHLPQQEVTLVESYYAGAENIAESLELQRQESARPVAAPAGIDPTLTEGSARLAGLVQERVYGEVARNNSAALDAGVKRETLFVLTRSFVPGALVELTCLSNPDEAVRLADPAYRTALAAALADAVRDYRRSLRQRPLGEMGA